MDRLKTKKAWVVFTFSDGTKETILTTLSPEILRENGVSPREGFFWDFSRERYAEYRRDAVDVGIYDEKPVEETEVLRFASRFV